MSIEIPREFNLAVHLLDENIKAGRGDRVAIIYQRERITYLQVQEKANRLGNALLDLGVRMENRVFLLLYDSPEFVFSFFGAIKIGAVPIPTNTMLKASNYEYMLNDCRAEVIVVHEDLAPLIEERRPNLRFLKHLIVVGSPEGKQIGFQDLISHFSPDLQAAPTVRDDIAFWQYSSGTTGDPKGTVHQHQDMVYSVELYAINLLGLNGNDTTLSMAKLFFGYGLGNGLCFPFAVGASTVLMPERPQPEVVFEAISTYKPTVFFGVPTAYKSMLLWEGAEQYDLSSLRLCVSAGENLPVSVYEKWKETFGLEILDGLGTTEMLHIFVSNRPGEIVPGSSGKPVPGYEIKIVDDEGREVPDGEVGTLLAKGGSSALYYWNKREKTKTTMLGEWLNTGDKYYRDKEGYLWYMGRADDMIKAGGIWVSPTEVEQALLEHPSVSECAVIGAQDEDGLVKPMAFVVLNKGYRTSTEQERELKGFVKSRIARYKYPRWIQFVPEIPKTATGKTQRFRLRRQMQGQV